jgi:hypothetical protein
VPEVYSQDSYDGIAVTVEHYTEGSFQAFVTVEEDDYHRSAPCTISMCRTRPGTGG